MTPVRFFVLHLLVISMSSLNALTCFDVFEDLRTTMSVADILAMQTTIVDLDHNQRVRCSFLDLEDSTMLVSALFETASLAYQKDQDELKLCGLTADCPRNEADVESGESALLYRWSSSRMLEYRAAAIQQSVDDTAYLLLTCNQNLAMDRDFILLPYGEQVMNDKVDGYCYPITKINIRGYECQGGSANLGNVDNFHFHLHAWKCCGGCCGWSSTTIDGDDNFGYYGNPNHAFSCSNNLDSTTDYWIGSIVEKPTDFPTEQPSVLPTKQPSVLPSEQPSVLPTGDQGGEGQVDEDGEEDGQGEDDGVQGDEERNSSMFGGAMNSLGSIWMLSALGLALLCCLFCFLFILERRKTSKLKRELEQQEIVGSPSGPSPTTQGASTAGSSSPLPPPVPVAMVPPQNSLVVSMPMLVPVSSVSMPSHNTQQNIMMAPGSLSQFSSAGLSMEPAQSALPSSFLSFQRQQEVGDEADGGNEGVHNAPLQGGTLQMQQNADNDVDDIANDEEDYDVDAYVDEVQMTAGAGVNTLGGDEYEYYDADIASDEFVVNDDDGGDNRDYGGTRTKS